MADRLKGVCCFHSETGTEGGYWAFQDGKFITKKQHEHEIDDSWSYEGLRILENGDQLTIFSSENPSQIVWSGTISLRQHPLFTERACGFWIHTDQEGIDRETWAAYFFKEYPAELVPARKL